MTNANEHALGVDVGDLEVTGFVDAQPGGVTGHEQHPEAGANEGLEESAELVGMENDGQGADPLSGEGDVLNLPGAVEGDGGEELEGGGDLAGGLGGEVVELGARARG